MPESKKLIRDAHDAIGKGDSDNDWKIVPTEHAEMFKENFEQFAAQASKTLAPIPPYR